MHLEALIEISTGCVLVVKPAGSQWGRAEVNQILKLDDPELETKFADQGFLTHPYAVREKTQQQIKNSNGNVISTIRRMRIVEPSLVRVKVDPAEIQKIDSVKPGILVAADANTPVANAVIVEVKPVPLPSQPDAVLVIPDFILPQVSV